MLKQLDEMVKKWRRCSGKQQKQGGKGAAADRVLNSFRLGCFPSGGGFGEQHLNIFILFFSVGGGGGGGYRRLGVVFLGGWWWDKRQLDLVMSFGRRELSLFVILLK